MDIETKIKNVLEGWGLTENDLTKSELNRLRKEIESNKKPFLDGGVINQDLLLRAADREFKNLIKNKKETSEEPLVSKERVASRAAADCVVITDPITQKKTIIYADGYKHEKKQPE